MNPQLKRKVYGWVCALPAPIRSSLLKTIWNAVGWLSSVRRLVAFQIVRRVSPSSTLFGPPKGLCRSAAEWCKSHPDWCPRFTTLKEPAREIRGVPPRTADGFVHDHFKWAAEVAQPATWVAEIQNGRVVGPNALVITPDDLVLGEVSIELSRQPERLSIFERLRLPSAQPLQGTVAVIAVASGDVYFHWMFEVLPRLDLLRRAGYPALAIDRLIINDAHGAFAAETLNAFGVAPGKCVRTGGGTHFKAEKLIVPSLPGAVGLMPKESCDLLRREFLPSAPPTPHRKLYISRASAKFRRIANEEQVQTRLIAMGFEVVHLEKLSVREQAALFAAASIVVAPHGAGLTNIVFCNPGTRVIEMFSENYINVVYWILANHVRVDYRYLVGTNRFDPKQSFAYSIGEDIHVDVAMLERTIRFE